MNADQVEPFGVTHLGHHGQQLGVGDAVLHGLRHVLDGTVREEVRGEIQVIQERFHPQQYLGLLARGLGLFDAVGNLSRTVENNMDIQVDGFADDLAVLDRTVYRDVLGGYAAAKRQLQFAGPEGVTTDALPGQHATNRGDGVGLTGRHDARAALRPVLGKSGLVVSRVLYQQRFGYDE